MVVTKFYGFRSFNERNEYEKKNLKKTTTAHLIFYKNL